MVGIDKREKRLLVRQEVLEEGKHWQGDRIELLGW